MSRDLPIDGVRQGLLYGSTSETLWFRLRAAGQVVGILTYEPEEGPSVSGTCVCAIYDPNGSTLLSSQTVHGSGSSDGLHYVDGLNISTWDHDRGYRAYIVLDNTAAYGYKHVFNEYFDVCMYPISDPVLADVDIDRVHPQWKYERTNAVSDWVDAIHVAHARFYDDVSKLRDRDGKILYPHRMIDRNQLYQISMTYLEDHIVRNIIRSTEEERKYYSEKMSGVLSGLSSVFVDDDDDLVVGNGEDEEDTQNLQPRFRR